MIQKREARLLVSWVTPEVLPRESTTLMTILITRTRIKTRMLIRIKQALPDYPRQLKLLAPPVQALIYPAHLLHQSSQHRSIHLPED